MFRSWRVVYFEPAHRTLFYSEHTYIFKRVHVCYWLKGKINQLILEGSPSFMVVNFPSPQVPCSKQNCPCTPCVSLIPHIHSQHTKHLFYTQKTTLTSLILLLGTRSTYSTALPAFSFYVPLACILFLTDSCRFSKWAWFPGVLELCWTSYFNYPEGDSEV